ncbi:chemotaxis protein CheW [Clostridium oceanicum]|uniref:Chemotaxis protein CheW n=1 Tax=Clostridium oceanicum TaxID=1543 RepID=A0ABN1JTX8_9CLOT
MENKEAKVLIFSINDEYYAADIMEVERILGYEEPTKLPDAPSFVEGVINYQGKILPVISLSKKFNLGESKYKNDRKIIVAKEQNNNIGIIVDVVSEVKDIKLDSIEEAPEIVAGISRRYIRGLIKIEDKIIIFLNLSTILTEEEKTMI